MSKSIFPRPHSVLLVSMLMLVVGCNGKEQEEPSIPELISEVKQVTIAVMESEPPQLSITAEGMVNSAGWSDPVLEAVVYTTPPADGIYEFNFTAAPSLGPGAQVVTPIKASHIVNPMPEDLVGVRIHAVTNEVTELLETTTPQPTTTENIFEVSEVTLAVEKGDPSQLSIAAAGSVKTAGWSNPGLAPFVYVAPPEDGIYDFNFVAVPPAEGTDVAQVITPIKTSHTLNPMPEGLKGVRIHSAQNNKEQMLNDKQ